MPGGDRTGPEGYGPRTGRNLGYCAGYNSPGFTKGVPRGRGFGFGRGWGRGFGRGFWGRGRGFWRRGYYPEPYYEPDPYYPPYQQQVSPESSRNEEKSYLENMVKSLEGELKLIKERLQELSKEKKEEP
jgi:hypothetical protein